jgi:hypothetical protein
MTPTFSPYRCLKCNGNGRSRCVCTICPSCDGGGRKLCSTCSDQPYLCGHRKNSLGHLRCPMCDGRKNVEVRCITCGGSGTQLCPECKGSFRTVRFSFLGLQLYRGCKVCAVRSTFPSGVTKCSSCLGSQKQSIKCTGCRGKGLISCSMCSNGQCPECKGIPEHCASCRGSGSRPEGPSKKVSDGYDSDIIHDLPTLSFDALLSRLRQIENSKGVGGRIVFTHYLIRYGGLDLIGHPASDPHRYLSVNVKKSVRGFFGTFANNGSGQFL